MNDLNVKSKKSWSNRLFQFFFVPIYVKYIESPEATIPAYGRHLYNFAILLKETIDFTYFSPVKLTICQKG